MTIQEQVPDISICQEAQRKGVEIESNFKWYKFSLSKSPTLQLDPDGHFATLSGELEWSCSAPLTDEILEKLPAEIEELGSCHHLVIRVYKEKFYVLYEDAYGEQEYCFEDKKLSNALYLLYQKLKEDGII